MIGILCDMLPALTISTTAHRAIQPSRYLSTDGNLISRFGVIRHAKAHGVVAVESVVCEGNHFHGSGSFFAWTRRARESYGESQG